MIMYVFKPNFLHLKPKMQDYYNKSVSISLKAKIYNNKSNYTWMSYSLKKVKLQNLKNKS